MDRSMDNGDLHRDHSTGRLPLRILNVGEDQYVLLDDVLGLLYDSINIPDVDKTSVEAIYGMAEAVCIVTGRKGKGHPYEN
jgi:hypothetical protein